ncbi:MAG: hypothetical protein QNJ34_23985 [Xenococcaceae cyanobacterium MO_188.B29]|nr:hypothetical protein [Xenococcaceae cyanobacterium MO_188.B29]
MTQAKKVNFSRSQTFLEGLWNAVFSRYSLGLETRVYQRMHVIAFPIGDRQWLVSNSSASAENLIVS